MIGRLTVFGALAAWVFATPVAGGITFGPVRGKPGESVRLVSNSETPGGTVAKTSGGRNQRGTIMARQSRDLVWTFRADAPDGTRRGMVKVNDLSSSSEVVIEGKSEKTADSSPLKGKLFALSKAPAGEWKFELDGSVPMTRVTHEITELTHYLKREWFPDRSVEIGDSWEFDPAWVKAVIQKDLANAKTIGTMRLRQVRRTTDRETAVIDISIRSTGSDYRPDGSQSSAAIELDGQMTVNLATMLDELLELKGTVTTGSGRVGESTAAKLPVKLVVTKSFVRDAALP